MPIYSRKRTHSGGMAEFEQPGKPTLDIPVEILLKIVEEMGWDPISIGLFMRTSTVRLPLHIVAPSATIVTKPN